MTRFVVGLVSFGTGFGVLVMIGAGDLDLEPPLGIGVLATRFFVRSGLLEYLLADRFGVMSLLAFILWL